MKKFLVFHSVDETHPSFTKQCRMIAYIVKNYDDCTLNYQGYITECRRHNVPGLSEKEFQAIAEPV